MQVLKQSLAEGRSPATDGARRQQADAKQGRQRDDAQLSELSRQALYQRAQELDITGRSQMTKAELIEAIQSAA